MNPIWNFENELLNWINKNNLLNINTIVFDNSFGYDKEHNIIHIGVIAHEEAGSYFEEFLSDLGCQWEDIPYPVLALLHEIGHAQTIHEISERQLIAYRFVKTLICDPSNYRNELFQYWNVPDEFAANTWTVNFINENIEKVTELIYLYSRIWNDLTEYVDVTTLV